MQCAHIMAMAVQKLHPGTQVTIGPWIERGFYYDFDTKEPLSNKDLKAIKKEMQRLIKRKLPMSEEEVCHMGRYFLADVSTRPGSRPGGFIVTQLRCKG